MYNPELLNYILDRKRPAVKASKEVFDPKYGAEALDDYLKVKYQIVLFIKIICLIREELVKKLTGCKLSKYEN